MSNANLAVFLAHIEITDKAVQDYRKASWDWAGADRATRGPSPRMEAGADTVTCGNVSCKLSPAPQSARTNASRRNWKISGKRCTEAEAFAAVAAL